MDPATFVFFAVTTAIVVLSPGPAAITVASQGAGNGAARALFGISGVASANAVYFVLSATGIASLIIASHLVFAIIKWVGVAYLVYLGASALFSRSGGLSVSEGPKAAPRTLFAQGFVVEFANPKALLYFAAILPQFIDITQPVVPQVVIMGVATLLIDVTVYSGYAYLGQSIARSGLKPWATRAINGVAGSALWLAAFKMARMPG